MWGFLPGDTETRHTKAVPTAFSDRACEMILAYKTGEFILDDVGIHVSEERKENYYIMGIERNTFSKPLKILRGMRSIIYFLSTQLHRCM